MKVRHFHVQHFPSTGLEYHKGFGAFHPQFWQLEPPLLKKDTWKWVSFSYHYYTIIINTSATVNISIFLKL